MIRHRCRLLKIRLTYYNGVRRAQTTLYRAYLALWLIKVAARVSEKAVHRFGMEYAGYYNAKVWGK